MKLKAFGLSALIFSLFAATAETNALDRRSNRGYPFSKETLNALSHANYQLSKKIQELIKENEKITEELIKIQFGETALKYKKQYNKLLPLSFEEKKTMLHMLKVHSKEIENLNVTVINNSNENNNNSLTSLLKKKKKSEPKKLKWKDEAESEQKEFIKSQPIWSVKRKFGTKSTFTKLKNLIHGQILQVETDLDQVDSEEFHVMIEELSFDELEKKLQTHGKKLTQEISQLLSPDRGIMAQEFELLIDKLIQLQDDIASFSLRIAPTKEDIVDQVIKSLKHLEDVEVPLDGAYEALKLDKKQRKEIKLKQLIEQRNKLSESGSLSKEGQKVRQAGFTLCNKYSKMIYDAYLDMCEKNDKKDLATLWISPEKAKSFGLNQDSDLIMQLLTMKSYLEQLKKKCEKK